MKVAKLFVPGRFVDAFLYMGRVAAVTEERTLQILNLDEILEEMSERDPAIHPVATLMFARNDWAAEPVFKSLSRNASIWSSVSEAFDLFPQPFYELDAARRFTSEEDLGLPVGSILDMNIYNSRLYLGMNVGLFHLDLTWSEGAGLFQNGLQKRIDARCRGTSVGFGSINASCGEDGLFSSLDDFDWLEKRPTHQMTTIAPRSVQTNWLQHDLVNYASFTEPTLLRSKSESVRRSADSADRERKVITEIGSEKIDLGYLLDLLMTEYAVSKQSIQFTYNSTSVMFVHTNEGNFYALGIKSSKGKQPKLQFSRTYKGFGTRILGVNPTEAGLVIEADRRVLLFSDHNWYPIQETDVISVRTFPRSRRYRNVVAMTLEDGLMLVGLFDEKARDTTDPT